MRRRTRVEAGENHLVIANAGLLATSPWIADMVGRFSIEHYAGAGCTTPPTGAKFYPF